MDVPVAANILGTIGAVCWSTQLLPQIFINYRRHHSIGLQPTMMLLWASAGVPLGVYNIVEDLNVALRVQAQILTLLSLITWAQCKYYGNGWTMSKCAVSMSLIACLMGGIETALIFALKAARAKHIRWPSVVMAVLAACLLAAGVLRHYWDIYQHRTVRGISFIFVGIDAAGDLFSLVSIVFQEKLDILGMAIYGTELVLWIGVFLCGGYFNLIPWVREKLGRKADRSPRQGSVGSRNAEGQVSLPQMPSSTSVFRTPSSTVTERNVVRSDAATLEPRGAE